MHRLPHPFTGATKPPPSPSKSLTMARCSLRSRTMESFSAASRGAQAEADPRPRPPARLREAPQPDPTPAQADPQARRTHRAGLHGAHLPPRPPEVRAPSGAAGRSRKRRRDPLWSPAHPTESCGFFRRSFCIPCLPLRRQTHGPQGQVPALFLFRSTYPEIGLC